MKVTGTDRILVAVKDLEVATARFAELLGLRFDGVRVDQAQQVRYNRAAMGLELVQSTTPDGPVARFIEKRGEGLYGAILRVDDLSGAIKELEQKGLKLIGQSTIGGLKEAFFHPRDCHGLMIALCEYEDRHGATVAEEQG
ncbi:MAG: VOC family protein [Chloroflexota bacterium]